MYLGCYHWSSIDKVPILKITVYVEYSETQKTIMEEFFTWAENQSTCTLHQCYLMHHNTSNTSNFLRAQRASVRGPCKWKCKSCTQSYIQLQWSCTKHLFFFARQQIRNKQKWSMPTIYATKVGKHSTTLSESLEWRQMLSLLKIVRNWPENHGRRGCLSVWRREAWALGAGKIDRSEDAKLECLGEDFPEYRSNPDSRKVVNALLRLRLTLYTPCRKHGLAQREHLSDEQHSVWWLA